MNIKEIGGMQNLPQRIKKAFDAFDKVQQTCPQTVVRLLKEDAVTLENFSHKRFGHRNLAYLRYRGLSIV